MPKVVIKNARIITGEDSKESRQIVSFTYPTRKKALLQKLYGKNVGAMMSLLCDKLIADATTQQLALEFGEPKLVRYKRRTENLSMQEVIEIKTLIANNSLTAHQIAIQYGVDSHTIKNIMNNKCKKYVEADKIINERQ